MKGTVIASDATPDKNKLSTGTLTYSDIQNKADYNAESSGYSVGTQKGSSGYSPGIPVSGNAGSTTKSAIAPGTIVVGGKAVTPESLRRDTTTALNELGKIFDKKTVQEKQELVNLFSKEANQAIGDFAESMVKNAKTPEEKAKWKEGGEYKAILHAFASGFTSSLSGNDFLSGAIGDGISQLAQKELANIKDPTLRLFASAAIGAGAAKLVGGNAKIGAISAYNGTKYNDLIHHPTTPGAIVYSDGNPPNHEGRGYYEVQSDGSESYLPDGIKPGDVVWYPNGEYNDNGQQMGNEHIIGDDGKPIAIQWVATQVPVGSSALLQSFVTLYRAVNQETHEDVIVNGGTPMKDDSGTIYNQAVDENGKITLPFGIVAGFVNPGSGISALKGLYGFKVGITASEIKSINNTFGGRIELNGSIESVLENSARYDGFWEKTAAITRSIVNNHTFDNGNKRTAMTVIQELMERNGISTGVTVEGMKDVIYKISTGELKDVNEIAKALRGF